MFKRNQVGKTVLVLTATACLLLTACHKEESMPETQQTKPEQAVTNTTTVITTTEPMTEPSEQASVQETSTQAAEASTPETSTQATEASTLETSTQATEASTLETEASSQGTNTDELIINGERWDDVAVIVDGVAYHLGDPYSKFEEAGWTTSVSAWSVGGKHGVSITMPEKYNGSGSYQVYMSATEKNGIIFDLTVPLYSPDIGEYPVPEIELPFGLKYGMSKQEIISCLGDNGTVLDLADAGGMITYSYGNGREIVCTWLNSLGLIEFEICEKAPKD